MFYRFAGIAILLGLSAGFTAWGQEAGAGKDPVASASLPPESITAPADKSDEASEEKSPWFWFAGTSNYHNKLKSSERRIDTQINGLFDLLFPRWRRVTTFQDWRDQYLIWDLWGGVGRDLGDHLAWTIYGGGGMGTIRNRDEHQAFGFPADTKIYFTRKSLMMGTSLRWWPVGKPTIEKPGLWESLKGTRPVVEGNVGYTYQTSIAEVKLWTPLTGEALRIKQEENYHLLWFSPRAGVEVPLGHDLTLNALGGYLFFNNQQDDYNGPMLEFFVSGRF